MFPASLEHPQLRTTRYTRVAAQRRGAEITPGDHHLRPMTLRPVLHSFAYALDYLREQLADVAPTDMVAQPAGIPNHPAWTVGHLTHSCELLADVVGVPPWLPKDFVATRFGTGSVPVALLDRYEP
jgi:hypothetical protein